MITEDFFKDRLRFLRNKKQISAREMSIALGQNEAYINKLETGKCSTSLSSFLRICDYLAVSPADFFQEDSCNAASCNPELLHFFQLLTPRQATYVLELLKDLTVR